MSHREHLRAHLDLDRIRDSSQFRRRDSLMRRYLWISALGDPSLDDFWIDAIMIDDFFREFAAEFAPRTRERDAILRPPRPREARLDVPEIQLHRIGEDWLGRSSAMKQSL